MSRSILDAVSGDLGPIARAAAIQGAAARAGFDWPDTLAMTEKIDEETRELRDACRRGDSAAVMEEIGDILLVMVNVARAEGFDAEACLRHACAKFDRRFRALEARVAARGERLETQSPRAIDALWNEVKEREKNP